MAAVHFDKPDVRRVFSRVLYTPFPIGAPVPRGGIKRFCPDRALIN
jgi:hypothetical protein